MGRKVYYRIEQATSLVDLVEKINNLIYSTGYWLPAGGVIVNSDSYVTVYIQAMYRTYSKQRAGRRTPDERLKLDKKALRKIERKIEADEGTIVGEPIIEPDNI